MALVLAVCCGCSPLASQAREIAEGGAASGLGYVAYIVEYLSESSLDDEISERDVRDESWEVILTENERLTPFRNVVITGYESPRPGEFSVSIFIRETGTTSAGLNSATVTIHGCATVRARVDEPTVVDDIDCAAWLRPFDWRPSKKVSLHDIWRSRDGT